MFPIAVKRNKWTKLCKYDCITYRFSEYKHDLGQPQCVICRELLTAKSSDKLLFKRHLETKTVNFPIQPVMLIILHIAAAVHAILLNYSFLSFKHIFVYFWMLNDFDNALL